MSLLASYNERWNVSAAEAVELVLPVLLLHSNFPLRLPTGLFHSQDSYFHLQAYSLHSPDYQFR